MRSPKTVLFLAFLSVFLVTHAHAQTIEVSLRGRSTIQGKPVYWDNGFVAMVARDGKIVTFRPSEAEKFQRVSRYFDSFSQSELRGQLLREFGGSYDVSGTGQFLVVHPAGQRDRWAQRFEKLYRSMVHYFGARGFELKRPEFPFVAVVFPTRARYEDYMNEQKVRLGFSSLGYYDSTSNRIHLYDSSGGSKDPSRWFVNAETIIHEAAHQTAFNIGIHKRYGNTPTYIVEGIGTLFEARGVWNAHQYPNFRDRINPTQLRMYKQHVGRDDSLDILNQQITSDRLFKYNSAAAYAHSWALTFFLTETEPRRYAELIEKMNSRKNFRQYTAEQRMEDFTSVFGDDLRMFDARLQRFVSSLK